jgi:hypothetical protein
VMRGMRTKERKVEDWGDGGGGGRGPMKWNRNS